MDKTFRQKLAEIVSSSQAEKEVIALIDAMLIGEYEETALPDKSLPFLEFKKAMQRFEDEAEHAGARNQLRKEQRQLLDARGYEENKQCQV